MSEGLPDFPFDIDAFWKDNSDLFGNPDDEYAEDNDVEQTAGEEDLFL